MKKYIENFSNKGFCCCCDSEVIFKAENSWYRDHYLCTNCGSIPRERALMYVIEEYFPEWRNMTIHESSPIYRGASKKLQDNCKNYVATQFYPRKEKGLYINGVRNENLEEQTFKDNMFDLVITQDVMEHIFNPEKAFKEIARTLKKGGAHIFTVPLINKKKMSERWAILGEDNDVQFLKEPEYHGNPVDSKGSPVTFHWGYDIVDYIYISSGLITTIAYIDNIDLGIRAEYIEVLISTK